MGPQRTNRRVPVHMDVAVSVRAYDGVVPRPPPLRTERPEQGSPVGQYFVGLSCCSRSQCWLYMN